MYAGCVACCLLVSRVEYEPRALLGLEKRCDRRTDRYTTFSARLGQHKICNTHLKHSVSTYIKPCSACRPVHISSYLHHFFTAYSEIVDISVSASVHVLCEFVSIIKEAIRNTKVT